MVNCGSGTVFSTNLIGVHIYIYITYIYNIYNI